MRYGTKRTKSKYPTHPFNRQLRGLAQTMTHKDLARKLGITTICLWNWMYHNTPGKFALKVMQPKLDKLLKNGK